jgi:hypothetical protein
MVLTGDGITMLPKTPRELQQGKEQIKAFRKAAIDSNAAAYSFLEKILVTRESLDVFQIEVHPAASRCLRCLLHSARSARSARVIY